MNQTLMIEGGYPLSGEVKIPAAKNSVLPLLAASLLCEDEVTFFKVPELSDVSVALKILNTVGAKNAWQEGAVRIWPSGLQSCYLPAELTEQMRASVLFLGPLLSHFGRVETGMCGGCRIGARPIDIHLDGFIKMGAHVCWGETKLVVEAPRGLTPTDYTLRYPSVGATESLMMTAVKLKGITTLRGVAREPEIVDLANFLNACGAKVRGAGSSVIEIIGVPYLSGVSFTPLPDRIVGATFACAVAATGGTITLKQSAPSTFLPVLEALRRAGCTVTIKNDDVTIARSGALNGIGHLATGVYPLFPTDAAPLLAAALLKANSQSNIEDVVFENRFSCAAGFAAMGANVIQNGNTIYIAQSLQLRGANVFAPDLRGGAALVIAALAASGTSEIEDVSYISRGYANLMQMFGNIGGKITQKNIENT